MALHRSHPSVPSVLDRLISGPGGIEVGSIQPSSPRALKLSVARDLTALLNSRRGTSLVPSEFPAASSSILNYGLPDISSYNLGADPQGLRRDIESTIRAFEPRLSGVKVTVEDWDRFSPVLKFHIHATLKVGAVNENISFNTILQADCRIISIKALG
ncbi:MAG TPA: type VI secretion system baseplate subunit TssE [Bryobacteraceae bacterium]|nr:type VI secretion system baseplate subunit TssE [Bryobacteraceae bacterium]